MSTPASRAHRPRLALQPLLVKLYKLVGIAALDGFRRNGGGVGVKRDFRFRQPCRTAGGGNRRHAR